MKTFWVTLASVLLSLSSHAQPLDPHYLDACKRAEGQLKTVHQVMAQRGGRPLARTSPHLKKSEEECFTQPKDVKLSDEEVQQSRGAGGSVGIMRTGLARSRLGSEKMKGRFDRCSEDGNAIQEKIKEDRQELLDQISERREALKQYEDYARQNYVPAAEQRPHLERFRQQISDLEADSSKTGQVASYARDAYNTITACYARLQAIYDKAAYDYEQGLADVSSDETVMASTGPPAAPPEAPRDSAITQLGNQTQDYIKEKAQEKAIQAPIEQGVKQAAKGIARVIATQAPKRLINPVGSAISDIVMPSANPGGACSGAPVDDPWKRYNAGCFRVNSVGSAIGILKKP